MQFAHLKHGFFHQNTLQRKPGALSPNCPKQYRKYQQTLWLQPWFEGGCEVDFVHPQCVLHFDQLPLLPFANRPSATNVEALERLQGEGDMLRSQNAELKEAKPKGRYTPPD